MNLFKKIGIAVVGMAMAVGVGVAVGTNGRDAAPVNAETGLTETINESDEDVRGIGASGGGTGATVTRDDIKLVFSSCYGHASNKLIVYGSSTIKFQKAGNDVITFKSVVMTGSSSTYIRSWNASDSTQVTVSNTVATWSNNTGVSELTLTNGSGSQARLTSIVVTYDKAATTYSVTYNANTADSGSVPTDSTKYNNGASVTVAGNTGSLVKANHAFSGWTLNAEGTGTVYGPGDGQTATYTIASANVTFYAKWVDTRSYIDIEPSGEHLSLSGTTHVLEDSTSLSVTLVVDATWKLPTSITITGAADSTWSYNASTGVISGLNVAKTNVTISGTATKASISAIEVAVDDSEKSFYLGHEFTHLTAVVTGYYDDPYLTEEDVTAGCTWSEPDMFTTGNSKEITVTHTASGETDSYTISVSNKATSAGGVAKVTNVSDLTVGSTVYLVCEGRSKQFNGINTSGSTHYGNGADYTTSIATATYPLTIAAGNSEGTIAFKTGNNYLYWNSGNSLDTNSTLSDKTSWTVSISSGNATILNKSDNTRQVMWNVSSPRFACYSGQTPTYDTNSGYNMVQIYKDYPAVTKDLIKITASATSTTRYVGDTVTVSDFNVTAYYDDGTNGSVTATSLTNATLNSTSNTVTVNYTESAITKSVNVVVAAEERSAELNGLTWEQAGLTVFKGDELDFSTLGTITASYDDDSEATKGIVSCTVGLYSKAAEVYTREKTITDGHEFALSEDGLYLGVEYTEDAITVKAYASAVVNVVDTINAVYEQEPVYTFSRVTSINSGDVVTFVNETASKVASGYNSGDHIITVSSYTTDVETSFSFEVGKVGDYYTFHNANGYLGNHSTGTSGSNYAYLDAEIDGENNYNYFTVTFDGNNIVITSVYNSNRKLQFNGTRFCFYGSNQSSVQLYKGTAGYSPTGSNIANTNAVAQKAVLDYVEYFNTTMACVNDGSTANVPTKWTAVSNEFTRVLGTLNGDALVNFKALFTYAYARGSDEFLDADELQDMLAKYNHIVSAHNVNDFLNDDPINRPTAEYASVNTFESASNEINTTATIIAVVSMVSLASIGCYFFLRRRKEF